MTLNANTKHLLLRAGFGPVPEDDATLKLSDILRHNVSEKPLAIVDHLRPDQTPRDETARKAMFQQARKQILTLNRTWVSQLASTDGRLREKMTLFWHDHFACRVRSPFLAQQNNNVLRAHALGDFRTLLLAVSKDPAMLQFLNNQQNRKNQPNENFAREVMELFTMGRGHYTERDIKEAARAFTGWAFNPLSGAFVFREKVHDYGVKTFLGKTGKFTGEDIIDMILDQRATAAFITEKLYGYFIGTPPDEDITSGLARQFYESQYSVEVLMKALLSSPSFYAKRHRANRIKSPVELLAGIIAQTGGSFENPDAPLFIQRALGQVLFYPPNVGGWPTDTGWIDSSSLTFRLTLPNILFGQSELDIEAKDDGDVNNVTNVPDPRRLTMLVNWSALADKFNAPTDDQLLDAVENYLLARPTTVQNRRKIRLYTGKAADSADVVKRAFVAFMSLPEYQLS